MKYVYIIWIDMNWYELIFWYILYIYTFYLHLHVFTNFVKQLPVEFFSPQKKRCRRQALEAEYRASLEVFNAMKVCRSILHAKVVDLPLMVQKIQLSKISGLGSLTIHMLLVHFKLVSWEPDFYRDAGSSFCSCTSSLWSTGLRDGRWVAEDLLEDLWPLSILAPEVMMRCALLFGMGSLPCHLFFFDTGIVGLWQVWVHETCLESLGSSVGHGYDTSSTKQIHRESMHAMCTKSSLPKKTFFLMF